MQVTFDFGASDDLTFMRDALRGALGPLPAMTHRSPLGQLIKSLISNRTKDEDSLRAYNRLVARWPQWADMASASVDDIQATMAEVSFPDVKAPHLLATLQAIQTHHPDFNLDFLGAWPVEKSMAWLEQLPGVGRKVAASALNFSTLRLPSFVIDTLVLRVLRRFGFVRPKATAETAYEAVMAAAATWGAEDLIELHVMLKRLGQTLCPHDEPQCSRCALKPRCATGRSHK